jgi:hypothetical protein
LFRLTWEFDCTHSVNDQRTKLKRIRTSFIPCTFLSNYKIINLPNVENRLTGVLRYQLLLLRVRRQRVPCVVWVRIDSRFDATRARVF